MFQVILSILIFLKPVKRLGKVEVIKSKIFYKDFTLNDIQLLFKLRTRMINVKKNFSSIYENLNCEFCDDNEIETQKHLLYCKKLLSMSSDQDIKRDAQYEDIFSDPEKQLKITRYMQSILKVREKLQDKSHENSS